MERVLKIGPEKANTMQFPSLRPKQNQILISHIHKVTLMRPVSLKPDNSSNTVGSVFIECPPEPMYWESVDGSWGEENEDIESENEEPLSRE